MNLNHLAIFHAVALEGNISRAAERLSISQPAVSKQLRELEANLRTPLFDRLPRGVRLTEAGALLEEYAGRLFATEAEAERALSELRELERGRLHVGASVTIGSYLLPRVLAQFHRKYPGIALSVDIANTESIHRALLAGSLDIGLTEGGANHPGLIASVFREDTISAIAPPGHPLLSAGKISARRFAQEPFIAREPGSGTREVIEEAFATRGLVLTPMMTLGNIEAIKRAVSEGIGVAMVSALSIENEIASGELIAIELSDLSLRRPLHLVSAQVGHRSRAADAFALALAGAMALQ